MYFNKLIICIIYFQIHFAIQTMPMSNNEYDIHFLSSKTLENNLKARTWENTYFIIYKLILFLIKFMFFTKSLDAIYIY